MITWAPSDWTKYSYVWSSYLKGLPISWFDHQHLYVAHPSFSFSMSHSLLSVYPTLPSRATVILKLTRGQYFYTALVELFAWPRLGGPIFCVLVDCSFRGTVLIVPLDLTLL